MILSTFPCFHKAHCQSVFTKCEVLISTCDGKSTDESDIKQLLGWAQTAGRSQRREENAKHEDELISVPVA